MIGAIKLYREQTGVGLKQAKDAVEAFERGERLRLPASLPDGVAAQGELLALLKAGQKIEAIKLYRDQTGAGLKEAKDAVEDLAARHGIVPRGAGCAGMLVLLVACLGLLALWVR